MRCKLLSAFFLLFSILLSAQDKKIYLDSLQMETVPGKHKYYRLIKDYYADSQKKIYRIYDYYSSDKIKMIGTSKSKDYLAKEGQFIYYFENGNKKSSIYYKDNIANGNYFEWYENESPKLEALYVLDPNDEHKSMLQIIEYWDAKNLLRATGGNGDYEEITEDETNFGKIKDGFKDGVWTGNNKKIKYSYTEMYSDKSLISGVSIDSNKVERNYKIVEIISQPHSGMDGFYKFIGKNFRVPQVERLSGKILTSFEIDVEGNIRNPRILKSIGYGTDAEALRVLRTYSEKWVPRQLRGIKLTSTFTFPINIQSP